MEKLKLFEAFVNEDDIRARGVIDSKEALVAFMTSLVRGEVAQLIGGKMTQTNIKIILADIGFDQIEEALDEIKKEVERLKKEM